ncbi:MAG: curli biogenesis system outer membrane secretion channel CsgG [Polaribacter sp.]|jgi:curli biogenesis system outer membrane secretion channel CsgG
MNNLKKNNFRILVLILISLGIVACQDETGSTDKIEKIGYVKSSTNSIVDIIAKAKNSLAKAAEVGFEWSSTAPLIKQAVEAENSGNSKLALELANKAIKESENSLVQAKYADEHWQDHAIN